MRYGWLPLVVISVSSSSGLSAGLSAAENTFRLEETTIAEIHEAVAAGGLSSEKLVELYVARIAAYDRAGPRLNSIIYINPNARSRKLPPSIRNVLIRARAARCTAFPFCSRIILMSLTCRRQMDLRL
jgi:hypothetical protein